MSFSRIGYSVLALSLAAGLSACDKKPQEQASTAAATTPSTVVVKIGHAAPLTGPQAHLGKDNENGVRLAIEDLNAKGIKIQGQTVKFELMSEDDQADARLATTVADKFVDAKVNGVIGHLNSGTTIPASSHYHNAGIVQISPSATNPTYTGQGFKTAFRVMANDTQQGRALAEYSINKLQAKRIAVIDDKTAYGQGLMSEYIAGIKAQGGTIVKQEYTTDKATDFTAILTNIKAAKPDLLFYAGMDAQSAPMVKQMRDLGLKIQFLTGDGGNTAQFSTLAGDAAEGVIASLPGVPTEQMPGGPDFIKRFTAKYGPIQLYAPYCYDAMMVMAEAMQRANSVDPKVYVTELPRISYPGVTATIAFDHKGDLNGGAITIYQMKAGKWQALETVKKHTTNM